jgi:hypothetical protein
MSIPFRTALGLILRRVPVARIRAAYANCERHRLPIALDDLVSHYRANGNIESVIEAAINAPRETLAENLPKLFGADLAGDDLDEFIARGYKSPAAYEMFQLRAAAQESAEGAARYRTYLLGSLISLDAAARRYAESELPAKYKSQAAENFPQKRAQIEAEIAELESKYPEIKLG